ncbi:MAG: 30S ribosome-binding factor RbfA [Pseudomonadota bacterium]
MMNSVRFAIRKRTGKAASQRQLRVGELIRHELARLLHGDALMDKPLCGQSFTVTEVKISPDLNKASVYVVPIARTSAMIGEQAGHDKLVAALGEVKGYLRSQLASRLDLRRTPDLHFHYDTSFDHANRIERYFAAKR